MQVAADLAGERAAKALFPKLQDLESPAITFAYSLFTNFMICLAWVFFRATDFDNAMVVLLSLFGNFQANGEQVLETRQILQVALVTLTLLGLHHALKNRSLESFVAGWPKWLTPAVWTVMIFLLILNQGNGNAFIYFQF